MSAEIWLEELIKVISFLLFSIVKFLYSPGVMIAAGYGAPQVIVINSAGGTAGAALFFYTGRKFFAFIERFRKPRKRKVFTSGKRRIIKFKKRFGLFGLAFIVPLISVPVSAVIAAKYYRNGRVAIFVYALVLTGWSIVLTLFSERIIALFKTIFGI